MPFALVFIGLLMIVTGARDTQCAFATQVKSDLVGTNGFIWYLVALGMIGLLGYVQALEKFAKAFLVLVIIAMILAQQKNGAQGFFTALSAALKAGPTPPPTGACGSITNTSAAFVASTQGTPAANNSDVQAQAAANQANKVVGGQSFFGFLNSLNPFAPTNAY